MSKLRVWNNWWVVILFFHLTTVVYSSYNQYTNHDEAANIVAGLSILKYGRYDLYCVNPPLVKILATIPIACFCIPEVDWKIYENSYITGNTGSRPEFSLGLSFVKRNNDDYLKWCLFAARLTMIPFSLLGSWFCFRWARELYGNNAGICSMFFWCTSPSVLSWSSFVMSDMPAAASGVAFGYYTWRWLKEPEWHNTLFVGVFLGITLLTKLTWFFLVFVFPITWLYSFCVCLSKRRDLFFKQLTQVIAIIIIGIFVLNLGYCFEGSFNRLGNFHFASKTLAGTDSIVNSGSGGNRFRETNVAFFPIPFPKNYIIGADLQKVDFEKGLPSYLNGKWKNNGWWFYYIECTILKTPLGFLVLFLLMLYLTLYNIFVKKELSVRWSDQIILIFPALVFFIFVSVQSGFSRHFRYVLPAFPFVFIWTSQIFEKNISNSIVIKYIALPMLCWMFISTVIVWPHYMSYFNELGGGAKNGHQYLIDSNIDWGQDVTKFHKWLSLHPEIQNIHVTMRDDIATKPFLDANYPSVPKIPLNVENIQYNEKKNNDIVQSVLGPQPGWFAISVHQIHERSGGYLYLLNLKPVYRIGYSINVYYLSLERTNSLRRQYGLNDIITPQYNYLKIYKQLISHSQMKRPIKIALWTMNNNQEELKCFYRIFLNCSEFLFKIVTVKDIHDGKLNDYDLLIVPGGNANEYSKALGEKGKNAIRVFVNEGGGYLGICAGAFLATTNNNYGLRLINTTTNCGTRYIKDKGYVLQSFRGTGLVDLKWENNLCCFFERHYNRELVSVPYTSGPVFKPAFYISLPDPIVLARFATEITNHDFQKGQMIDTPAIIYSPFGKGAVLLISPHVEMNSLYDKVISDLSFGVARYKIK